MRYLFTAFVFFSSISFSIAGINSNQTYDFGSTLVEITDSIAALELKNKMLFELKADYKSKNRQAWRRYGKELIVLFGVVTPVLYLAVNENTEHYGIDFGPFFDVIVGVAVLAIYVIHPQLFITLHKNKRSYKKSIRSLDE